MKPFTINPILKHQLKLLRDLAGIIGATGTFTIRGVRVAELTYLPEGEEKPINLKIAPGHPIVFIAIFSDRDGVEGGIESS